MDNTAKPITAYPGKIAEGLLAAFSMVVGFGSEAASVAWRRLRAQLSKRSNKEHSDHVAHILMAGQRVPGYEEAFESLEEMTEAESLEVFVCMARQSARWDRAYRGGDDPFGDVRKFLDRLATDRISDQKMDLLHRLAHEAIGELKAARALNRGQRREAKGRDRYVSPLLEVFARPVPRSEIPSRRWDSR